MNKISRRKRRGRGEGSIYQRKDGTWVASISLGYHADGTRNRPVAYGKTKREARENLQAMQSDALSGLPVKPEALTVDQHFQDWLRVKKADVRKSTHYSYTSIYERHIKPVFGHLQLKSLDYRRINALYEALDDEELSTRTVGYVAFLLRSALEDAVRKGIVPNNQANLAAGRNKKSKKEARFLNQDEIKLFLEACKQERLGDAFALALHTGLRPGEWLGLSWDSVDLKNRRLTVRQALHDGDGIGIRLDEVKTAAGRRTISLPEEAVNALKRQRVRQLEEKLITGIDNWENEHNLVFTNTKGGPLSRQHVGMRIFRRVLFKMALAKLGDAAPKLRKNSAPVPEVIEQAGFDGIVMHTLRHTHVSILIYQGVDIKTISARLGHEDVGFTLQVYGHLLPGQDEKAAAAIDAFTKEL